MGKTAGDEELLRRAQAGERAAFAALIERYRGLVYGIAYHFLGNRDDAQDIAQEAFVLVYVRLAQLRDVDRFAPWLRRLTTNLCLDIMRRRDQAVGRAWVQAQTCDERERLTQRLLVQDALSRLSEKTRLTVILCYLGGYSHAEVARFLEIPLNTVRSRLQHAKRQLREEMQTMIGDTLHEDKPDEVWTLQAVDEAMRRGTDALTAFERGEAVRHYDEALAALGALPQDSEHKRLESEALWQKGKTLDAIPLMEQALAYAEKLDDRPRLLDKLMTLADAYYNQYQDAMSATRRRQALALAQELGDQHSQARCLTAMATGRFWDRDQSGLDLMTQARDLFDATDDVNRTVYCQAFLSLATEIGHEQLRVGYDHAPATNQPIVGYYVGSDVFKVTNSVITHPSETCYIGYTWPEELARSPLQISRIFWQVSHLWKILDAKARVGTVWSGNAFSHTMQPLRATVTQLSDSETVTAPAGTFSGCLLTEQITTEAGALTEQNQELCGTRRAWYAPGIGLVQIHVRRGDGLAATIQLHDFTVMEPSRDYLPLTIGNRWEYGWLDIPAEYTAKEVYQVAAHKDDLWYLAHYAYADKR